MSTSNISSNESTKNSGGESSANVNAVATLYREPDLSEIFSALNVSGLKEVDHSNKPKPLSSRSVEQIFDEDMLIARAMDPGEIFEDACFTETFKLKSVGKELDLMEKSDYRNVSSTLLVKGQPVGTYKTMGFLFDGATADIRHIYGTDSNSATNNNNELTTGTESHLTFSTLQDLATEVREGDLLKISSMNEVNANYTLDDLKGIYVLSLDNMQQDRVLNLTARIVQKLIERKIGRLIPIYKYDPKNGTIIRLDPSKSAEDLDIRFAGRDPVVKNCMQVVKAFFA